MNRNYKALELNKILEMLAEQTGCLDSAERARNLEPFYSLEEVQREMDDTEAAFTLTARFGSPSTGGVKNVTEPLKRAKSGASLSMRELLQIAETLRVIRSLKQWRERCEGVETCLDGRFDALAPNKYFEEKINNAIISEEEMSDNASPGLANIRRKISAASSSVHEKLNSMIRSPAYQKMLQDPIVTIRSGRYVLPVKSEHRGDVPGLIHDTSASGATVFVEPMAVVEANNRLRVLLSEEKAEIERILSELSAEAGGFADSIIESYNLVTELDFIFAKSRLAYKLKAVRPLVNDDGRILLRRARHPLLNPGTAVPIDVELGLQFDSLIITGPNTGGKTVTLKTIGLLTLMAMCGLMIPADDGSMISVFGTVFVDIGDEQSIEQSLSTFSAHMTNIIGILKNADRGSLVLIDELGAGTDPVEGAALAMAILERLRLQGARIAATTHYAELKEYAINTEGVENGSCEFDVNTLSPTYRLLIGIPGRSNAFAISERLGMDERLVARAREFVSGESQRMEDVVSRLERQRKTLEEQLEEARSMNKAALQAKAKAEQRLREIEQIRDRETERAKADARRIVDRTRAEAEALISELDALRKEKNAADFSARTAEAKSRLRSHLGKVEEAADPVKKDGKAGYKLPRPLEAGDEVIIADIDKKGVVISPADSGGYVQVQAGIIKTRVKADNLRLSETQSGKNKQHKTADRPSAPSRAYDAATRTVQNEIDLRGKMTEEGILELDRFIDRALMSGINQITVIHGRGTGAMRSAVRSHLKAHPGVKSWRPGLYGEGEDGVTIVEI